MTDEERTKFEHEIETLRALINRHWSTRLLATLRRYWQLAAGLGVAVGLVIGFFVYQHVKQDHESLHTMVTLFNYCLQQRPDCKAMFTPPQPVAPPGK